MTQPLLWRENLGKIGFDGCQKPLLRQCRPQSLGEVLGGFLPLRLVGLVPQIGKLGLLASNPFNRLEGKLRVFGLFYRTGRRSRMLS